MKSKLMKGICMSVLFALLFVPCTAHAEGFGVYEWSATGSSMAENNMFGEEDASVLAYNPSQITKLKGTYFSAGATWFNPDMSLHFTDASGQRVDTHNNYHPITAASAFYTNQINDKSWWGVGIFPRFGNEIEYDRQGLTRYDTIYSGVQGITFQPTYAFKPHDKWSIALGLDINYFYINMEKDIPAHGLDLDFEMKGRSFNLGWLASVGYDFDKKNSAAVTYRSRIKHNLEADVNGTVIGAGVSQATRAEGSVTLPDSITFGFGHKFNDRTRIEFDAVWTNWSTYDALNVRFSPVFFGLSKSENPKNWSSAWRLGIGLEHKINDKWTFLCGYGYDESPVPYETFDFTVPTGSRHRASFGFKYKLNKDLAVTLGYSAIFCGARDILSKANGIDFTQGHINDNVTQILSLGLNWKIR